MTISRRFLFVLLALTPLSVLAANRVNYLVAGSIIFLIAVVVSLFAVKHFNRDSLTLVKVLVFGVYFWILIFIQSMLFALISHNY